MITLTGIPQAAAFEGTAPVHGPRLAGWSRKLAVGAWAAVWLLALVAFFLSLRIWYLWDRTPYAGLPRFFPDFIPNQYLFDYKNATIQIGLSLESYAILFVLLRLISGVPYFILSFLIVRRRSDRLMAVLFAIFLAVAGAAGRWLEPNWRPLPDRYPWLAFPVQVLSFILFCSYILAYTFPDGRFVPRWTRWLALFVVVYGLLRQFTGDSPLNPDSYPGLLPVIIDGILMSLGIYALVNRFRKSANPVQRQQIKWVVAGLVLLAFLFLQDYFVKNLYYPLTGQSLISTPMRGLVYELVTEPGWYLGQALLAICVGISVFRYRLWDIDLVINRVLVYGALTLLTMGVYVGAVAGLGTFLQGLSVPVISFLSAGLVAILFEPLRRRLQRGVNRLMYGERDEPYAVLIHLSSALETAPSPGEALPAIARNIAQALKIPYVAIRLEQNGEDQLVAVQGSPRGELLSFPLVYQGEMIGSLQLARRSPGEEFSSADRRLIETIARQAGAPAQAVRLNAELVRSRAQIVAKREEERRRIRRDLHDELGPILAGQSLKMAAVRELLRPRPEKAEGIVDDIIRQNERTVAEIRRLVHGLRPPALDELGLTEAVRDFVRHTSGGGLGDGGLEIKIEASQDDLPNLPAAVEANAYRIVLEALSNASRHAQARHCTVKFQLISEDAARIALAIQIQDDGTGLPPGYRAGVGLRSMRERAEELGGRFKLGPAQPHGTQIDVWLPLSV